MKQLSVLLLLVISLPLAAQQINVDNLRLWAAPDHTRVVFDTGSKVSHTLFSLKKPERLVIDIKNSRLSGTLPAPAKDSKLIRKIRSAGHKNGDLRVVLDLKQTVKPKSFVLKPNQKYGHRLVIDLYPAQTEVEGETRNLRSVKSLEKGDLRDIIIAIDAGHGGDDPGAKGESGTYEKDVVLAIARELETLIGKERGMHPVMIRKGDYYLGLRKRMQLAREERADLFISIHADAARNLKARGSSVYTLSPKGASSEAARWLAERENSADLMGGVKLEDKDDILARLLLDLSQTASLQASHQVAKRVLMHLEKLGKTHKTSVQQARFVVLKSPDVPSILVETAFISNSLDEGKLKNPKHQQKLAQAMLAGIREHFILTPPPGTLLAHSTGLNRIKYTISRGDTLSGIANQYQVSLRSLRSANKLKSDRILIGQVITIPET